MIGMQRPFAIKWVLYDHVVEMVNADEGKAQQTWEECCFTVEIFRNRSTGVEKTQAEFLQDWLLEGYPWTVCLQGLGMLHQVSSSTGHVKKRLLPQEFRDNALKRLRESDAVTYDSGGGR